MKVVTTTVGETLNIAKEMALNSKSTIFALYGNLGSGKTTFVKGFAASIGIPKEQIKSPTYTLLREYKTAKVDVYHFDFYRIEKADELMLQDLQEIFNRSHVKGKNKALKKTYCLIEWPERVREVLPENTISLFFEYKDENSRHIYSEDI